MKHMMRLLWEKTGKEEVRLLRVYGETSEVVIPAYIENAPVTEIGSYCFSASERLLGKLFHTTEMVIEDHSSGSSIQETGSFDNNSIKKKSTGENSATENNRIVLRTIAGDDLVKICLPDTVRIIDNAAFYNCRKLESLEVGPNTKQIGSDVFINCNSLGQLHIRCRDYQAESAKALLSRISTELEVYYYETVKDTEGREEAEKKHLFASILYPEYFETYDEIAPAHIFGKQIEGEGFRARQCFKEGQILFGEYDKIFQKAKAEETVLTVGRMCMYRLLFPIELAEEVKGNYETFLKENEQEIGQYFVKEKNKAAVEYFFRKKLLSYGAIDTFITCATKLQWSEGVSFMLHWKHQFYEKTQKKVYKFEPL